MYGVWDEEGGMKTGLKTLIYAHYILMIFHNWSQIGQKMLVDMIENAQYLIRKTS